MKTVFIINKNAGKKSEVQKFIKKVTDNADDLNNNIEVYFTQYKGDATAYVKEYCKNNGPARFIACGGDGTINEVINGVMTCVGAEAGAVPIGTGNDFCRNFSDCDFFDISLQMSSKTELLDAIFYTSKLNGEENCGYGFNMFNIGFDCNVADKKEQLSFITGPFAYFVSILINLIAKKGADLLIETEDECLHNGKLLLISVANGCYCGGGIKSNPLSDIKNGFININVIKNISRLKFLSLLPSYMKGRHIYKKNIEKIINTKLCHKIKVRSLNGKIKVCVDGEIINSDSISFEIKPNAFKFVVPKRKEHSQYDTKTSERFSV
ncbi:MAG: YegS/Rv2252/BmrU family lipid kinase [Clostridia bacterium]|nr:YegS/Rv2252/BmrU family lipid kinase [Clostridia bacterium]